MPTDELLAKMASVLFFGSCWHARAAGATTFFVGQTPREAMEHALGLVDRKAQAEAESLNADLF